MPTKEEIRYGLALEKMDCNPSESLVLEIGIKNPSIWIKI